MGQTEIEQGRPFQQPINHDSSSGIGKYQMLFFQGPSTVDAPPPTPRNVGGSTGSSNSASQRALRSGALRYATFQGWPLNYLSPRLLSDAGFFYRGTADQTQCAFCCITISQWEPNDDPMTEHKKYAPNCPFVLDLPVGNIPLPGSRSNEENAVRAAPLPAAPAVVSDSPPPFPAALFGRNGVDVCGFRQEMRPNAVPQRVAQSTTLTIRPTPDENGSAGNSDFSSLRVQMHQPARHPELSTLEARLNTFRDWPASLAQRPAQLAEAGFFYMSTGDHVKCFCCDGALRNWEPNDDPWVEHSRWFSRCNFLLSIKGEDFVKEVHSRFENGNPWNKKSEEAGNQSAQPEPENGETAAAETAAQAPTSASPAPSSSSLEASEFGSSGSSLEEALLCKICFDQQMSIVFLPCGHSLSCPSCATALSTCPLCRKSIQATVRAFFSFS